MRFFFFFFDTPKISFCFFFRLFDFTREFIRRNQKGSYGTERLREFSLASCLLSRLRDACLVCVNIFYVKTKCSFFFSVCAYLFCYYYYYPVFFFFKGLLMLLEFKGKKKRVSYWNLPTESAKMWSI